MKPDIHFYRGDYYGNVKSVALCTWIVLRIYTAEDPKLVTCKTCLLKLAEQVEDVLLGKLCQMCDGSGIHPADVRSAAHGIKCVWCDGKGRLHPP